MAKLTERELAQSTAITPTTLIHIVTTEDITQDSLGSSYKAELGQLTSLFSGATFTGGTVPGNTIINGNLSASTITITSSFTPSGTTDTTGIPGSMTWDDDNFYYKTNNGWFIVTGNTF